MKFLLVVLLLAFQGLHVAGQPAAKPYLFFLHGKILEEQPVNPVSPEFGAYRYEEILRALEQEKLVVLFEKREKDTDVRTHARKVVGQIDSLLRKGVKAEQITVAGTSKGAIIAMFVSTYLKNPQVNFVLVADCNDHILQRMPDINLCGSILSIYEKSDSFGQTCIKFKERSSLSISRYHEIEANTGLKHGLIYGALPEWIVPTVKWAKGEYTGL